MGQDTRARAPEPRMSIAVSLVGRVRFFARDAGRAITQVAFRGQLGPVGGHSADRSRLYR
jgi:hypothetical protein